MLYQPDPRLIELLSCATPFEAFDMTLADPAFVDFKKLGCSLVARSGEEVAEIVSHLLSTKPQGVAALKETRNRERGR